jgi:hypothetical protein
MGKAGIAISTTTGAGSPTTGATCTSLRSSPFLYRFTSAHSRACSEDCKQAGVQAGRRVWLAAWEGRAGAGQGLYRRVWGGEGGREVGCGWCLVLKASCSGQWC